LSARVSRLGAPARGEYKALASDLHLNIPREIEHANETCESCLISISALIALAAWVTSAASPGQADANTGSGETISITELQQRIDVKSLPFQQIVDPI
jgi:hypothetical protein